MDFCFNYLRAIQGRAKVVKEHWTGVQDNSERASEVRTTSRKLEQIASDMETDAVLTKEDITDMVSQIEPVKEEANPFFRASHLNSRGFKHVFQLWQQHHHKQMTVLRAATRKTDRTFANIWDRWENDLCDDVMVYAYTRSVSYV